MKRFLALAVITMLSITGIALAEGIVTGTVLDADGMPVEEARVALQTDDVCGEYVFTDADGVYLFENVEAGVYDVKASKRRVGNGLIEEVEVVDGETTTLEDITLVAGGGGQGGGGQGHGGGKHQYQQGTRR
jgi:Carboxypeptidase regulatory-like domain